MRPETSVAVAAFVLLASIAGPPAAQAPPAQTPPPQSVAPQTAPAPHAPPGGAQAPPRRPRVSTTLTKYRGPGDITFVDNTPAIEKDKVTTTAKFSMPGEYFIRVEGNDSSGVGGGGFQCCWTTAYMKVNVKASGTGGK